MRQVVMQNFYCQLCALLIDKQTKVTMHIEAFRPIFVYLWILMLQNFITERAIEIDSQKKTVDDEIVKITRRLYNSKNRYLSEWATDDAFRKKYAEMCQEYKSKYENADLMTQKAMVTRHIFAKHIER